MVTRNGGGRSLAALLLLSAATALPIATPRPGAPVQISVTTNDKVFVVMRDNLVFLPPDPFFYVAKQLWRDSISSTTTYVSLQMYNAYTAGASLNAVSPRRFITRNGGTQPQNYTANDAFTSFATESRLFQVKCCDCARGSASVTFYFTQGGVTNILTTQLDTSGQLVQLARQSISDDLLCTSSNLKIQAFPIVEPLSRSDFSGFYDRSRRSTSTVNNVAVVELLVDYGVEQFVVGVQKSRSDLRYELVLLPYKKSTCTTATRFHYQQYLEYHVSALSGSLTYQPAFTLQHAASRLYVTTDVMDNMALNITGTGLTLTNEAEFNSEPSETPDYRYFTRYDGPALKFLGSDGTPSRINSSYFNDIHIFCALYHRRYCLQPAKFGPLQLVAVSPNDTSPYPTLEDPLFGFSSFLESLDGSSIVPTFKFVTVF